MLHAMTTNAGAPPAAYIAAQAGPAMPSAPTLRLCPACTVHDTARYGEPYWHRLHQAPGVAVCPIHGELLQRLVGAQETDGTLEDQRERPSAPVYSDTLTAADRTALIAIATDVAWYLVGKPTPTELQGRYQQALEHHDWLRPSGQIRTRFVRESLQPMVSETLWAWLASDWASDAPYTWIEAILRHTGAVHPIRHILLQECLVSDAKTFWRSTARRPPSTGSAWPCKNPVADHRGDLRVLQVIYHRAANSGQLLGTGACPDCGFTYRQRAANGQPTDDRSFRIIEPGAVWVEAFTADWEDDAVPLGAMVQRFHLTYAMVHRMAHRLGLSPQTPVESLPGLSARWRDPEISVAALAQQYGMAVGTLVKRAEAMGLPPRRSGGRRRCWDRESDRERWRTLCHQHPQASRSALRRLDSATFARLIKHDKAWLNQCTPARSRTQTNTRPIDWDARDRAAYARVSGIVNRWYFQPGRPKRCTPFRICVALSMPFPVWTNLYRLPRTAAALRDVHETDVGFAIRRLEWVAKQLHAVSEPVTATTLQFHVGLTPEMRRHPAVMATCVKLLGPII